MKRTPPLLVLHGEGNANKEKPVRLLLINPNMTAAVTERLAAVGRSVADPGTEIVALTATRGFPYGFRL